MTHTEPSFLAAYLVVGDDDLKTSTVIKRLTQRLEALGDLDFNSQTLDCTGEVRTVDTLDALNTPPLGAPYRLVLIKNIDKGSKDLTEMLITYLKSPLESTILMMTAMKMTSQARLYKAVAAKSSKGIIDASSLKGDQKIQAMVRQLAQSYHINLDGRAAALLVELTGSSSVALNTEVKKLASFVFALGRSEVSVQDVQTMVARTNQPSVWNFVDAFARRELVTSLEILHALKKETPVGLLSLLVMRIRELLNYRSLAARKDRSALEALGKKDWQLRQIEQMARNYTTAELRSLLTTAAGIDARMKSGEDAQLLLEQFLLSNCR